jgi:hypothetical protein
MLQRQSEPLLEDLKVSADQYAKDMFQTKPISGIRQMEREIRYAASDT